MNPLRLLQIAKAAGKIVSGVSKVVSSGASKEVAKDLVTVAKKRVTTVAQKESKIVAARSINEGIKARQLAQKQMVDIAKQTSRNKAQADIAIKALKETGVITPNMATKLIVGEGEGIKYAAKYMATWLGVNWKAGDSVVKATMLGTGLSAALALYKATIGGGKDDLAWAIDKLNELTGNKKLEKAEAKNPSELVKEAYDNRKAEENAKKEEANKNLDPRTKAARQAIIDKLVEDTDAAIAKLKDLDNQQRDKNKAAEDAFRDETKSEIERMKAQFKEDLANADKGSRADLRKEQSAQLKTYREQRKTELDKLKAAGKAKVAQVKKEASKAKDALIGVKNSLQSHDAIVTGFYTDKNGKHRPITAPKGK